MVGKDVTRLHRPAQLLARQRNNEASKSMSALLGRAAQRETPSCVSIFLDSHQPHSSPTRPSARPQVRKPYPDNLAGMSAGLAQLLTAASSGTASATSAAAASSNDLASFLASSSESGNGGSGSWTPGGGWAPGAKWGPSTCPPNCLDLSAFKSYFGPHVCCCNAVSSWLLASGAFGC